MALIGLPNPAAVLLARYEQQPLLKGLVQLVPLGVGSALESALLTRLNTYRAERLRTFFDELGAGKVTLTEETIQSDDFLHCYFATLNAVLRSRRRDKVRFLARLLKGGFDGCVESVDEYEELVAVTDDLTQRELWVLALLARHERDNPPQKGDNGLQRATRFWPAFVSDATTQLGIDEQMLAAMLVRIQRSGCYEEFTGAFLSYTGGVGRTTVLYERLAKAAGHITDFAA